MPTMLHMSVMPDGSVRIHINRMDGGESNGLYFDLSKEHLTNMVASLAAPATVRSSQPFTVEVTEGVAVEESISDDTVSGEQDHEA